MSAPAWTPEAKIRATKEGLTLVKVYLQGKHTGHGTYGVSMAMGHAEAMLLAAICNHVSDNRSIPEEAYNALGVEPPHE